MAKVLLFDDDELVRYVLSKALWQAGHEVTQAANGLVVTDLIEKELPDIMVTDLIMPGQEGLSTITEVHEMYPDLPIIAISGGGRNVGTDLLDMAMYIGANATLTKPFDEGELIAQIETLVGE